MGVPRISQTATCQCKIADLSHKKHSEYINYMRIDQMIKGTNQNDIGVTIFQIRFPCHIHAYMNCLQRNPLGLSRHLFVPFRPSHPLICPCLHIYIQWPQAMNAQHDVQIFYANKCNQLYLSRNTLDDGFWDILYICHDKNTLSVNVFLVEINLNSF